MRLWSIHPKYLDSRGLVAVWREAILAKQVLAGKTQGYRHHPQLNRFRQCNRPANAINAYLQAVHREAVQRGYRFDARKFRRMRTPSLLTVTRGQLNFEMNHLLKKLRSRDHRWYRKIRTKRPPDAHPLFRIIHGGVERWEILS